jgi:hypothetical protein
MKAWLFAGLAVVCAALGARLRLEPRGSGPAALDEYRLRVARASLARGHAPELDRALDASAGSRTPVATLWPATVARIASWQQEAPALQPSDFDRLERLARRLGPACGALTCLALFGCVFALARANWAAESGLLACAAWALAHSPLSREAWGRFDDGGPLALLALLHSALMAWMLRTSSPSDALLAALFGGSAAGLATLSAGPGALVLVAGLLALAPSLRGDRHSRARRPTALLWLGSAATWISMGGGWPRALDPLAWPASGEGRTGALFSAAVAGLSLAALGRAAWAPSARPLAILAPLGALGALWLESGQALLDVCACALLGLSLAHRLERHPRPRPWILAAAGALAAALVFAPAGSSGPVRDEGWQADLAWLRANTQSPAPVLEPHSHPSWRVLAPPGAAWDVVARAERAVVGAFAGEARPRPGALRAAELFALADEQALAAQLALTDVRYVAAGPIGGEEPLLERARSVPQSLWMRLESGVGLPELLEAVETGHGGPARLWRVRPADQAPGLARPPR